MSKSNKRLIKRYQNRKLYDTTDSCYVTLDDLGELVRSGEDIQVIDNSSKEDLTSITLSQIIFEQEKKRTKSLPLSALTNIVRSGGETLREFASKAIESSVREFGSVRDDVQDLVERLVKRGRIAPEEQTHLLNVIRQLIDSKVRPTIENVSNIPAVQSDLRALQTRIEELERRLRSYEHKGKKK